MQYYSVYDLIIAKSKEHGESYDETLKFFHKHGFNKSYLVSLSSTPYIPKEFEEALQEFTDMNMLEINLSMGYIPAEYRNSYFNQISSIAELLKSRGSEKSKKLEPYFETKLGKLYHDDCLKMFQQVEDNTVDLIFADPPFNLDKVYDSGVSDNMLSSDYINWMHSWLDQCIRVLKPGGQIFIYNLPKWTVYIASYLGERLTFRNWIAVDMKFSLPIAGRLYPAHYGLVNYIKGVKPNTFNNQRIPAATCRHCGGEQADYGGYKNKMNPKGINVSDVWSDIYPVRHHNDKNRKYNELSIKLLDRIISMASNEGDLVLDPFGGSGTTFAVSELLNRRWIGSELGDCEIIKQRLLDPEQDQKQYKKILEEKNHLFPDKVVKLRKKNHFWVPSDFQ